jgi:O-acetyl-ADP-ribose deacetylase (regulator of RNase III)
MSASESGPGPEKIIGKTRLRLEFGDLTKSRVAAVVNAANPSLMGGGGVDGAIHRAGGPAIIKECRSIVAHIGRLEPGRAVITTGGRLLAKYVIHTVGPIWRGGNQREAQILAMAYRESLKLADHMALDSVAFPSSSTGAYGYPLEQAAEIALRTVKAYLEGGTELQAVVFVLITRETFDVYRAGLDLL